LNGQNTPVIYVVYDFNNDAGYAVRGTAGQAISNPPLVRLYHELSHAYHHAIDNFPFEPQTVCPNPAPGQEDDPTAEMDEHVVRSLLGLCLRDVCDHRPISGPGSNCGGLDSPGEPPKGSDPNTIGASDGWKISCFIVTAATGSPEAFEIRR